MTRDNVEYPPMEHYENGKLTGFHVNIVNEVAAKLGIQVEWQEVPWARAMKMVETGEADAITYLGQNPEREKWAIYKPDNVLSAATFSFIARKENASKLGYDGNAEKLLKARELIVIREFALPESVTKANPKKQEAANMKQAVDMLLGRQAEVGIINKDDFLAAFKGTPAEKDIVILEPPAGGFKNFIAFSKAKGNEALATKFAAAMAEFKKTPRYAELKKKYGQ